MATKIQFRRDSSANWTSNNPVLAEGEIGLDLSNNLFKIGDGTSGWNALGYWSDGVSYSITEFTATASQTNFSVNHTNLVEVRRNGFELSTTDYTLPDTSTVSLVTGANAGDLISIKVWSSFNVSDALSATNGGTVNGNVSITGTLGVTGAMTAQSGLGVTGGFSVSDTGAMLIPSGTTAQRPSTPLVGEFRFNTDTNVFEGYANSQWVDLSTDPGVYAALFADVETALNTAYLTSGSLYDIFENNTAQKTTDFINAFKDWFVYNYHIGSARLDDTSGNYFDNLTRSTEVLRTLINIGEGFDWIFTKMSDNGAHNTIMEPIVITGGLLTTERIVSETTFTDAYYNTSAQTFQTAYDSPTYKTFSTHRLFLVDSVRLYRNDASATTECNFGFQRIGTVDDRTTLVTLNTGVATSQIDQAISQSIAGGTVAYSNISKNGLTPKAEIRTVQVSDDARIYGWTLSAYDCPAFTAVPEKFLGWPGGVTTWADRVEYDLNLDPADPLSFAARINLGGLGVNQADYLSAFDTLLEDSTFVSSITPLGNIENNMLKCRKSIYTYIASSSVFYSNFLATYGNLDRWLKFWETGISTGAYIPTLVTWETTTSASRDITAGKWSWAHKHYCTTSGAGNLQAFSGTGGTGTELASNSVGGSSVSDDEVFCATQAPIAYNAGSWLLSETGTSTIGAKVYVIE